MCNQILKTKKICVKNQLSACVINIHVNNNHNSTLVGESIRIKHMIEYMAQNSSDRLIQRMVKNDIFSIQVKSSEVINMVVHEL